MRSLYAYIKNELNDGVASKIYKVQHATGMTSIEVIGNIVEKWVEGWDDDDDDEWKTSY